MRFPLSARFQKNADPDVREAAAAVLETLDKPHERARASEP